jgi:hypothetical protein
VSSAMLCRARGALEPLHSSARDTFACVDATVAESAAKTVERAEMSVFARAEARTAAADDDDDDAAAQDEDTEVYANGVAFSRAASWLGASASLTHETFAALETSEHVQTIGYRTPRLGLGATHKKRAVEAHNAATHKALTKSVARQQYALERKAREEALAAEESDSDSEDDRSKALERGKKSRGVYGRDAPSKKKKQKK